ncbi:ALF repeat-containing protein [Streptomyces lichenis]|uniref:ALF repeat-containing protein n=1 Tax=Streptomyces lichenis TaxID=2306967 RepID=A0ABT0IC89_9ACTN|nr:ALF repeat-containing protein [Streptomyces lichenis]MCK8678931.1 ALF repeat-containing protein [Streptomyces lichenis]
MRTAATEALQGTDQQVADFYASGQYQVAETYYRAEITKLANDGGASLKDQAKKALANGSTQALLTFLKNTQYSAAQQR